MMIINSYCIRAMIQDRAGMAPAVPAAGSGAASSRDALNTVSLEDAPGSYVHINVV